MDFDGVLSAYTGWQGPDHFDSPLPGSVEALKDYLRAGFKLVIHTTRADTSSGVAKLRQWLLDAGLSATEVFDIDITPMKPPAWLYIDDRCYLFKGIFPTVQEIEAFKPYWEKSP